MSEVHQSVSVQLPRERDPQVARVGQVFQRRLAERSDVTVAVGGGGTLTVELALESGIAPDGFRIEDRDGGVRIVAAHARGLLYGVGKLLRTSERRPDGFVPGTWRGTSVPAKPVRGIYFASHFHNFYHDAPVDEIERYVEDLALWGTNALMVWFDMHHFTGIDDPAARAMLERLGAILKAAQAIGLDVGTGLLGNEAYRTSPEALRADDATGRAHYHVELCPHKPGAKELMLGWFAEEFDVYAAMGVNLDHIWVWPYDQGGCACEQCKPWGANGFLRMAEAVAQLARRRFPDPKVILSTWLFDFPEPQGEWPGLAKALADRPGWLDYILADSLAEFPEYPLTHPMPGGLPMLNFPEISMWGMGPWGGFGANPLPGRFQRLWDQAGERVAGGFPYSEGIYEDLNKAVLAQFYWDPTRTAHDTVREYVASEYSPDVVDDVARAIGMLEQNHRYFRHTGETSEPMEDAGAAEAFRLMQEADARLPDRVRTAWRWRILYLRALLDRERFANHGQRTDACEQAFQELTAIYHAQHAQPMVAPPTAEAIERRQRGT